MEITVHLAIGRDKFKEFFEGIGFSYNSHGEISDLDKYLDIESKELGYHSTYKGKFSCY